VSDLAPEMFDKLLQRLDADRDRAGEKYNQLQEKLVRFFRWSGCSPPEEYAQETLNRVARKIAEGKVVGDLNKYIHGILRHVRLEAARQQIREHAAGQRLTAFQTRPPDLERLEAQDRCLRECMQQLSAEDRDLIQRYLQGEKGSKVENRARLAGQRGVSLNALRIRYHRVRNALRECYERCVGR